MGKKNKKGRGNEDEGADGGPGDARSRAKVNHRQGKKNICSGDGDGEVPQELIDKAAILGCEVWEVEEYEARAQAGEEDDSDGEEGGGGR